MFMLTESLGGKLKAYSGTSRAGKHTLKIEVEYDTASNMAFDVDGLQQLMEAQKPVRKPARKPRAARVSKTSLPAEEC